MVEESGADDRQWLLEPVAPNEVRIHVSLGDGAEVSADLRVALDALVDSLYASEVEGFATDFPPCPDLSACEMYFCNKFGRCQPQSRFPCAWEEQCLVQPKVAR